VTSTLVVPVGVVVPIVTFAFTWVHDRNVTEFTRAPVAPSDTVAPLMKFAPVRVRSSVAPCAALAGLTEISVGRERPEISEE
jgi:hypothetical protein